MPFSALAKIFSLLVLSQMSNAEVRVALRKGDTFSHCAHPDPRAWFEFIPGCKEVTVRAGHSAKMEYNKHGLRDKDYPPKAERGWKRILFLGPSRLAGPGLEEKNTPPRLFEGLLRKKTKQKLEVINAGVEGYSTMATAAKLPEMLKAYSPSHALLFFASSNLNLDSTTLGLMAKDSAGDLLINPMVDQRIASILRFIYPKSNPYDIDQKTHTAESIGYRALHFIKCRAAHPFSQKNLARCLLSSTLESLQFMKRKMDEANVKFTIILTPERDFNGNLLISPSFDLGIAKFFDSITPSMHIPGEVILEVVEELGLPSFRTGDVARVDWVLPGDYHFNEVGSLEFAKEVAEKYSAD